LHINLPGIQGSEQTLSANEVLDEQLKPACHERICSASNFIELIAGRYVRFLEPPEKIDINDFNLWKISAFSKSQMGLFRSLVQI